MRPTQKRRLAWLKAGLTVGAVVAAAVGILAVGFGQNDNGGIRVVPDATLIPPPSTKPADADVPPPEPEGLLPEYSRIVDREGAVIRKEVGPEGALRTVFRSADGKLELVLLENRYLETLENVTEYGKKAEKLRVSGTVTTYRGLNYLLLSRVQIERP